MIVYEPLLNTMRKKGIDLQELMRRMGVTSGMLKRYLNEGRYISLDTIDRMCAALKCDVKDIIAWREGEKTVREVKMHCTVNWNKLDEAILGKNMDGREVSLMIGKSGTWYATARRQPHVLKSNIKAIMNALSLRYEDYVLEEHR